MILVEGYPLADWYADHAHLPPERVTHQLETVTDGALNLSFSSLADLVKQERNEEA